MGKTTNNLLKAGTLLNDKYLILEFVAKGGMGEVYRAHQLNLKRDVAVKVISQEWLESLDGDTEEINTALERLRSEVHAMAQVRHVNILQIYDFGSVSVQQEEKEIAVEYIVMEYIPGKTLRHTMSEEGFHPDEHEIKNWISDYFLPVLDGVQAMHMLGIVHRDLKPENVLMDGETPKIADFGLARSSKMTPITRSIDVKGSPAYMSPEHFFDFKKADKQADIYSLGKILYEAVMGKLTSEKLPFKQVSLPEPATSFMQKIDGIIRAATAEDKEDRPDSVEQLRNNLVRIIENSSTDISLTIERPSALFSMIHRKWLLAGVAVAVIAIFSISAVHFRQKANTTKTSQVILNDSQKPEKQTQQPYSSPPLPNSQSLQRTPTPPLQNWSGYPDCDMTDSRWRR